MSIFGATGPPVFGFLVMSPLGFKARVGCLIHIVEVNVMYVPWDPPLVLHLPTSWQPARCWSCPHILLQRWGCRDSNSCSQNICEWTGVSLLGHDLHGIQGQTHSAYISVSKESRSIRGGGGGHEYKPSGLVAIFFFCAGAELGAGRNPRFVSRQCDSAVQYQQNLPRPPLTKILLSPRCVLHGGGGGLAK